MEEKKPKPLSDEGKALHKEIFKDDQAKLEAVEENSNRPTKDLVKEAQQMVAKGETYKILIKMGSRIDISGVPFTVAKIKGNHLTLIPFNGYKLVKDTIANRKLLNYVKPKEVEDEV